MYSNNKNVYALKMAITININLNQLIFAKGLRNHWKQKEKKWFNNWLFNLYKKTLLWFFQYLRL